MEKRVWLITGCSKGFGKEFVRILAERGDRVIGTVRNQEQIAELESINPDLITGVLLDVQDQTGIDSAAKMIDDKFGRLDVLVNNAGYGSIGPIEEVSDDEMQRQFDVNVFGSVRMIKLALPFMRKQKSGHILNVTSIAGLNGFPGVGIYNGSKFALEGIGEALAGECKPLGINVTNIEPGPFRTEWAGGSATFSSKKISDYKETGHKSIDAISSGSGKQVGDPVRAVNAMIAVTELENPPVHLPLGAIAHSRIGKRLGEFKDELDKFQYIGLPTDFTEEELKKMDGE